MSYATEVTMLVTMGNLAYTMQLAGQLDEALPLLEQVYARQKSKLGEKDPDTLATMNNLSGAYQRTGRLSEARGA